MQGLTAHPDVWIDLLPHSITSADCLDPKQTMRGNSSPRSLFILVPESWGSRPLTFLDTGLFFSVSLLSRKTRRYVAEFPLYTYPSHEPLLSQLNKCLVSNSSCLQVLVDICSFPSISELLTKVHGGPVMCDRESVMKSAFFVSYDGWVPFCVGGTGVRAFVTAYSVLHILEEHNRDRWLIK